MVSSVILSEFRLTLESLTEEVSEIARSTFPEGRESVDIICRELENAKSNISRLFSYQEALFPGFASLSDKIKLNVGGENLDLKRSSMAEHPVIGWNLLSCLFDERWNQYLLKDKHGRIYFDYELDWFEPLLKCVRDGKSFFSCPCNSISFRVIKQLLADFQLDSCKSVDLIRNGELLEFAQGCQIKQLNDKNSACLRHLVNVLRDVMKNNNDDNDKFILRKVYDNLVTTVFPVFTVPFLFVCLIEISDGNVYCGLSDRLLALNEPSVFNSPYSRIACLTAKELEIFSCPSKLNNVRFGKSWNLAANASVLSFLQFISTRFSFSSNGMSVNINTSDTVVFYEIILSPNCNSCHFVVDPSVDNPILFIAPPAESLSCSNLSTIPPPLQQLLQSVTATLNKVIQCNSKFDSLCKDMSRYRALLYKELHFMMYFLYKQWSSIIITFPKPIDTVPTPDTAPTLPELEQCLHEVISMIIMKLLEMFEAISSFKDITAKASGTAVRRGIDPIAYFNVEGKRISILKDSIQAVIPESQLAIRVCSGRWEEQESDLDEDGNIDLDGSKEVLNKIFAAIRCARLFEKETRVAVPVSKQLETELKTVVDYLQIDSSLLSFSFVA
jgi:hypothetical protein